MHQKLFFCLFLAALLVKQVKAQELQKLYEKSLQEKNRLENVEKNKEEQTKKFISQALEKGAFWKCDKSVYIFYQGYVLISAKDDGSDAGKPPFDLIGNYTSTRQGFTKFTFPKLPYENVYELDLNAKELVIFKHSLNKLDKLSCNALSK
jgi:hypothetical protein